MFSSHRKLVRLILLLTIGLVWQSGCANLRLPAIDPYGRRVFLPRPAYTTLGNDGFRLRDCRLFPNRPSPAFTRPEFPPPACNTTSNAPTNCDDTGCCCLRPFGQRRRPLLDCLFGPEEDDQACCANRFQTDPCNQNVGGVRQSFLPVAYSNCPPISSFDDLCYDGYLSDPCADPCADPCLNQGVVLGQSAQTVPQYGAPMYAAPAVSSTIPYAAVPRSTAYDSAHGTRGIYAARLQLDPQRLVAPVGSEVVMRAGLCGDDGYLITKQPIEWSLSRDSVGSIVEVDEFAKPFWRRMLHKYPEKKSGDYAIGRTSTAPQVLTRGTLDPNDDIWVAEGQTWVSVTSASEGVSNVSAVAPSAAGWGERRQLATVQWVDGRWLFPAPTFAPAGTSRQITTNVRRATTGAPVPGWIVRYEIYDNAAALADGSVTATGATEAKRTLDVITDELGNATVNVTPINNQAGITQVGMQVIRVGNRIGDYDRVVVGQGTTSVTWTGAAGADPYSGDSTIPSTLGGSADQSPTIPMTPRLDVTIAGPRSVSPGETATYQIDFENRNATTARNADLSLTIPYGMQYVSSQPLGNVFDDNVRWPLSDVPQQGSGSYRVSLRADGPGPFRVCGNARVDGVAAGENCFTTEVSGSAPPSPPPTNGDPYLSNRLKVRMEGPDSARVGETVPFTIYLSNLSNETLPRVMLRDDFDSGLGHSGGGSPIEWPVSLGPGETKELPLRFTATTPGQQCHSLTVTSSDGSRDTARACINVGTGGGAVPPSNGSGGIGLDPYPTSNVTLSARTLRNNTPATNFNVGDLALIEFEVTNNGQSPLTNLQIVDEYDPALLPQRASDGYSNETVRNRLVWNVSQIDPGQSQRFQIEASCEQPKSVACHTLSVIARGQEIRRGEACVQIAPSSGASGISLQPARIDRMQLELSPTQPVSTLAPDLRAPVSRVTAIAGNRYEPSPLGVDHGDSVSNNLRVTVSDLGDPALINRRLTYVVMIQNLRDASDRNVVLTITLPAGAKFETSINPPMIRARNSTPDRRTVEFLPIAELRGGESATFRIVVNSDQTGLGTFQAEVTSARSPLPVVVTEQTTFFVK